MIFDTIANAPRYFALHPHFESAFQWLHANPNIPEGRYEIAGEECYVIIEHTSGRGKNSALLEAHDKYLDIQIALEGEDVIGWKARAQCSQMAQDALSLKDVAFWTEAPDWYFQLAPGHFAVLFPDDAHAPLAGEGPLSKAVFKIAVAPAPTS